VSSAACAGQDGGCTTVVLWFLLVLCGWAGLHGCTRGCAVEGRRGGGGQGGGRRRRRRRAPAGGVDRAPEEGERAADIGGDVQRSAGAGNGSR